MDLGIVDMQTRIIVAAVLFIAFHGFLGLILLTKNRGRINRWLAKKGWRLREDKIALKYLVGKGKILDVGCGDGDFMQYFPPGRITGIDIDARRIEVCHAKGLDAAVMDALVMDLDGQYEAVHCSHLIEHLYPHEFRRVLEQIDKKLVAGGTLIIRAPQMWKGFYDEPTHVKPYPPCAVIKELPNYRVERLVYSSGYRVGRLVHPCQPKIAGYFTVLMKICSYLGVFFFRKDIYILVLQKQEVLDSE